MNNTNTPPTPATAPLFNGYCDAYTSKFVATAKLMVLQQQQHKIAELERLLEIKKLRTNK